MAGMLERKPLTQAQITNLNGLIRAGNGKIKWGEIPDDHFEWVFGVSKWIYLESRQTGKSPRGGAHTNATSKIDSIDAYIKAYQVAKDKKQALDQARLVYFGKPATFVGSSPAVTRRGSDALGAAGSGLKAAASGVASAAGATVGGMFAGRQRAGSEALVPAAPPSPRSRVVVERQLPVDLATAILEAKIGEKAGSGVEPSSGIMAALKRPMYELFTWAELRAQQTAPAGVVAELPGLTPDTRAHVDALKKGRYSVHGADLTHDKVEGNEVQFKAMFMRQPPVKATAKQEAKVLAEIIKYIVGTRVVTAR